ncbi:PKD domain-containing protein [Candidatus Bathyarchaeota archaeon]|nr:MAG: PKD domain-containing protein [Candidatus Bathyarchaeota archaeon]
MDDHEYGITDEAAWLSFWSPIITAYKNEPMIIWQPRNEPSNSAAQLSTFYQDWITQDRNLGDNHWIIVSISYSQFGAPNDSTFLSAFPTVTDPLNQVAYDFHDYYFYQYHPAWSISDAQAYAANVPAAVLSLEAFKNAPAIVSEFGADASGGGPSPPDVVDQNCSCQYSTESLAYVVAVIQGLDNIKGAYGLWEAGDWDGSGMATGAMNIWGQTIPTPGPTSTGATYTLTFQGYDFDGANEETITMNGNLVASVPAVLTPANGATWVAFTFDITSFLVQGTNTLSFTHANSDCPTNDQVRNLLVSNQTNTIYSNATAENINTATNCTNTLTYTFTIGAGAPPPPPSTSFTFLPSSPVVNSPVAFTATTTGGTAPYTISWNFGDGGVGTGATTTHTYTTAQSFTVTETATDSSSPSQNAVSSKTVTVSAPPPLSTSFTFLPASPMANTPVTFKATTSGGTPPYSVTWNFGDGTSGTGTSVIHIFTSAQSFTVQETATDSSTPTQTATSSQPVTVVATTPLSATLQVSSSSPQVGQTVTFTASAAGGTSPYTYTMAFGDGATGTGSITTHAYSIAGSYTAKVTVTDLASPYASVTSNVMVNVQALVPLALAVPGNQTVVAGTWINFTIAASANIGDTVSLSATALPAGSSFNQATGLFSWKPSASQTGSYTIVFTATDSSYPSTPTSKSTGIQVNQDPPVGSNGGNGGSGGGSNGNCTLCGTFPTISNNIGLLILGGLLGLVSTIVVLTIKARTSLERTKQRMEI